MPCSLESGEGSALQALLRDIQAQAEDVHALAHETRLPEGLLQEDGGRPPRETDGVQQPSLELRATLAAEQETRAILEALLEKTEEVGAVLRGHSRLLGATVSRGERADLVRFVVPRCSTRRNAS